MDHGAVVGVAGGDESAGDDDAAHLGKGGDRVAKMLEELVGVRRIEGGVAVRQGIRVCPGEEHGARLRSGGPIRRGPQHPGVGVDSDDGAGGDGGRQLAGDAAGPAPDVDEVHARSEMRGEVGGRVGDRAAAVGEHDGHVVTVAVGLGARHEPQCTTGAGAGRAGSPPRPEHVDRPPSDPQVSSVAARVPIMYAGGNAAAFPLVVRKQRTSR